MTKAEKNRPYARDWSRKQTLKKVAEANRTAKVCQRKHGGHGQCKGLLETRVDRLGRVSVHCPLCERFVRGLCASCPRNVPRKRRSRFCAPCAKRRLAEARNRYKVRHLSKVREQARAYNRRNRSKRTAWRREWVKRNPGRDRDLRRLRVARRRASQANSARNTGIVTWTE